MGLFFIWTEDGSNLWIGDISKGVQLQPSFWVIPSGWCTELAIFQTQRQCPILPPRIGLATVESKWWGVTRPNPHEFGDSGDQAKRRTDGWESSPNGLISAYWCFICVSFSQNKYRHVFAHKRSRSKILCRLSSYPQNKQYILAKSDPTCWIMLVHLP